MQTRRWIPNAGKLLILVGIVISLVFYYRAKEKPLAIIDDDDIHVTDQVTVQTDKAQVRTLRQFADVYGQVEASPARAAEPAASALIVMPATGMVDTIDATEGSAVIAGQPIVHLDSRAASAAVDRATEINKQAQDARRTALSDLAAADRLRIDRYAATAAADLTAARAALDRLVIHAPIGGTVLRLNARAGETAVAGAVLLEIADTHRLTVACTVPVDTLSAVTVGSTAEVVLNSEAGAETILPGHVTFIDPGVDPATAAASVDVALDPTADTPTTGPVGPVGPAAGPLRIGQIVQVRLITARHTGLAVPEKAIVQNAQGQATVSVVERDFRWAVRHTVDTGIREGGYVEVKSPALVAGADVVTVGSFALTDECRIEVTREPPAR